MSMNSADDEALRIFQEMEEDPIFLEKLNRSIAQAERGEFIEEDEMDARVANMLKQKK